MTMCISLVVISLIQKMEVFFLEVNGVLGKGIPVLLLHGAGSSSEKWKGIGTLQLIGKMGIRAVALDLPGNIRTFPSRVGHVALKSFSLP